jgi:hypothetical protein
MRKPLRTVPVFFLTAALLCACGGADPSSADDTVDLSTESSHLETTGASATSAAHAKGVAELFVQEDPTIDPTLSAADNAARVQAQALGSLRTYCPNATVTLANTTVTVDFGANCTLPSIGTIAGVVSAQVSEPAAHTVQILFTFTGLSVNARTLDGTLSVSTTNGTSYTGAAHLTSQGGTADFPAITLALDTDGKGVTLSGGGTVSSSSASTQVSFASVHHSFGACYADAGSITLAKTTVTKRGKSVTVTETVTFLATTPATGQVEVQIGTGTPATVQLPAYGRCGAQ